MVALLPIVWIAARPVRQRRQCTHFALVIAACGVALLVGCSATETSCSTSVTGAAETFSVEAHIADDDGIDMSYAVGPMTDGAAGGSLSDQELAVIVGASEVAVFATDSGVMTTGSDWTTSFSRACDGIADLRWATFEKPAKGDVRVSLPGGAPIVVYDGSISRAGESYTVGWALAPDQ